MTANNHRNVLLETADRVESAEIDLPQHDKALTQQAERWAKSLVWLPATKESGQYAQRTAALNRRLESLLAELDVVVHPDEQLPEDLQWLHDNVRLVRVLQSEVREAAASLRQVPHVRTPSKAIMPRVLAIAQDLLSAVQFRYSDHAFSTYMQAFQSVTVLDMAELSLMIPALKLVALEEFTARAEKILAAPEKSQKISDLFGTLRELTEAPWKELLEPLIVFEWILAADPAKAYARMDFQSRELYRHTVAHYAEHSDCTELEIAKLAIDMAQQAQKRHN